LHATPVSGTAPQNVQLQVDASQLKSGDYTGRVIVDSNDQTGPRVVAVSLEVLACTPQCGASVCGTDPVCGQSCGTCTSGNVCEQGACVPDRCIGVVCDACKTCAAGVCAPVVDALACDDHDSCTRHDACAAGVCAGERICDASEADAGTSDPDAGEDLPTDIGVGAAGAASGCGCHVASGHPPGTTSLLLALLLAALLMRRARRR
jgi:MYXO-CTERM domain-containing protein